jgi:peroxiredoxin
MSNEAHLQKSAPPSKFLAYLFVAGIASAIVLVTIGWNMWQSSCTPELAARVNTPSTLAVESKPADTFSPQSTTVPEEIGVQIGKIAPDFTILTLDGGTFTLANQRGKPVFIFFMADWCGSCIAEATALAQLQQEVGTKVSIVVVNVDSSATPESLTQFKKAAGNGNYTWAFDTDQTLVVAYQVTSLDTTFILDSDGRIAYRDQIPTPYQILKDELGKLTQ